VSVFELATVDPGSMLGRRNPVAKLAACLLVFVGLFLTVDPVTPAIVLAAQLVAFPLLGVRLLTLVRRGWLLLIAAAAVALTNLLFSASTGEPVLVRLGPFDITARSLTTALGITLRLLAIALPGVVFAATTDPRDLADSLTQQLHAPAKFVFAALAALRLVPLLGLDWQMLMTARRSRGVAGGGPIARIRLAGQTLFALLVSAIRRGTRLATAMDARGFASGVERTQARQQRMHPADWALLGCTVGVLVGAIVVSVAGGHWRWLLS
jgi:energy-coupling factor transport system permease protein